MKLKLIVLALLIYSISFFAQKKKPDVYFMVRGKITQTSDFCGGARPSDEVMQDMQKARLYAGKTLYIRKGKSNDLRQPIVMKFLSDSAGRFTIMLKPGVYSIVQPEQLKKLDMKKIYSGPNIEPDMSCLKEWWSKAYFVLEIKDKNIDGLEFNFHHKCFIEGDVPCLNYTGPMPP